MKKLKGLVLIGIMVATMFVLSGCGASKTTVNLNPYITITAEGYDSMGTASYTFDYDAFQKDYAGKIKLASDSDIKDKGLKTSDELLLEYCVNQQLDKTTDLSNGDVVTLQWKCKDAMADEYFNVVLEYSDVTYDVAGLTPVGEFNPFDYVEVSFSGISPDGRVTITPDYNRAEINDITFTADRNSGVAIGDTIKVTATPYGSQEYFIEKYGSKLGETEKTYTADTLARYVAEMRDVPEDMYNKMDQQLQDYFNAHMASSWGEDEKASIALIGNYLCTLKDGMTGSPNHYLYFVYKVNYSNNNVDNFVYYWYGYYDDILLLEDGTCTVDLSDYTVSKAYSSWGMVSGDYLVPSEGRYFVSGFADLDTLFNQQIVSKIDKYEYVCTIDDAQLTAEVTEGDDVANISFADGEYVSYLSGKEGVASEGSMPVFYDAEIAKDKLIIQGGIKSVEGGDITEYDTYEFDLKANYKLYSWAGDEEIKVSVDSFNTMFHVEKMNEYYVVDFKIENGKVAEIYVGVA